MTGSPASPPSDASPEAPARYRAAVNEPQPGWYPDPAGSAALRWWDGERWTDDTHTPGQQAASAPSSSAPSSSAPGTAVATRPAPTAPTRPPAGRADAAKPRHPALAFALIIGLLVVALVAATALVASLNRPKLNTASLEQQIAQEVADAASVPAVVRCPDRVDLVEGSTFTCAIELEGGTTATAIVTQTDDKGGVSWRLDTSGSGTTP